MQLRLAVRGDLRKYLNEHERALPQSVTNVVRRKTRGLQKNLRRQIQRSGLGKRLGGAMRSELNPPRGVSINQSGRVFSKALLKRPSGQIDLFQVFEHGAVIRAPGGKFLAIPAQSSLATRKRVRPSQFRGQLTFIGHGQPRLVLKSNPNVVVFWLVRQVRIRRRLNINATAQRFTRDTSEQIVRDLNRRLERIAGKYDAR